jgi:hypothetical protein
MANSRRETACHTGACTSTREPSNARAARASAMEYGNARGVLAAVWLLSACGREDSNPFDADSADGGGATENSGPGSSDPSLPSSADGTAGTTSPSGPGSSGEEEGSETGTIKLDVGSPSGGFGSCECELIYLWVSDHVESTVSKINTRTLEEEGRYLTDPNGAGDPSRTSVNLSGDVAVANRFGGLVKFYADEADCVESNGMPGIQTSTGKDDVLPWDVEECRAWYTDFPTTNQRPVAWTGGTVKGPNECDASEAQVWTVTSAVQGLFPGLGGAGGVIAYLVDGQSGSIDEQFGAYGGAVNAAGDLFFSPLGVFGNGQLARVEHDSLDVTIWPMPMNVNSYGITVDHKGRVWVSSTLGSGAARFDPVSETWDVVMGFAGGSGLAEGPDDIMYVSAGSSIRAVHIDTLALGGVWTTQEAVKGVSFDADGYLWGVTYRDEKDPMSFAAAYKIDVATMMTDGVYAELGDPYTYSDMTGNALGSVACAPEG